MPGSELDVDFELDVDSCGSFFSGKSCSVYKNMREMWRRRRK